MENKNWEEFLAGFFLAVLIALVLFAGAIFAPPEAVFDGENWNCPAGYSVYASEDELVAGKQFVHCVK